MVVEFLCLVENDLHDIESGQPVFDDSPFDFSQVIPFRELFLRFQIDSALDEISSAVPPFAKLQPASSSTSKKNYKTTPEYLQKCRKTFTDAVRICQAVFTIYTRL